METRQIRDTYGGYRSRLVEVLRNKGVRDLAVLRAFGEAPRHLFVPEAFRHRAYEDVALPIGHGQTISQPSTHARQLEFLELRGSERVLEIGTGSGYQTALITYLAQHVISVERVPELAAKAREAIQAAGISTATVVIGDGTLGWRPLGPYDAIVVSAFCPEVPAPLVEQLAPGGRLVAPRQGTNGQELVRVRRTSGGIEHEALGEAGFVPLIGRHGFSRGTNDESDQC